MSLPPPFLFCTQWWEMDEALVWTLHCWSLYILLLDLLEMSRIWLKGWHEGDYNCYIIWLTSFSSLLVSPDIVPLSFNRPDLSHETSRKSFHSHVHVKYYGIMGHNLVDEVVRIFACCTVFWLEFICTSTWNYIGLDNNMSHFRYGTDCVSFSCHDVFYPYISQWAVEHIIFEMDSVEKVIKLYHRYHGCVRYRIIVNVTSDEWDLYPQDMLVTFY